MRLFAGSGDDELYGEGGNDILGHPEAWKTLTTFVLKDPDTSVVRGTNIPQRQISQGRPQRRGSQQSQL